MAARINRESVKHMGEARLAKTPKPATVPRRVLVVEDNIDNARLLAVLFASLGHRVEYAINAIVALDVAHRFLPEFVFLDLKLPDAHGAEVARQLRRNPALAATRIIAMTASGQAEDHAAALKGGCETVLMKPVPASVFEQLLEGG